MQGEAGDSLTLCVYGHLFLLCAGAEFCLFDESG